MTHAQAANRFEAAFLREHGIFLSPEALVELLHEVIAQQPRPAQDPAGELSADEVDALANVGVSFTAPGGADEAIARTALEMATFVAASLTVGQVAKRLRVDRSRIQQRLAQERTLYGFSWEKQWRIPIFQFEGEECLPHLGDVVKALPQGLHPLAVRNWFTLPHMDLEDEDLGRNLSPREWLLLGRDPAPLIHIATYVH
jgi:hypothetical protein